MRISQNIKRDKKGRFIEGHSGYWKGKTKPHSKETVRKIVETREKNGSYKQSQETKIKNSLTHKNMWKDPNSNYNSEECRKNISLYHRRYQSEATKKKISKLHKNIPKSEEHKKKLSLSHKGNKMSYETKRRLSKSQKLLWQNPKFKVPQLKKMMQGLRNRPTSFEKRIIHLCIKYKLPFVYTGDGRMLINFKNPDFVNCQDRIIIEVFFSWFKIKSYGSVENYKEHCRKKYTSAGWGVIFIDENDLQCKNWDAVCLNKIKCK